MPRRIDVETVTEDNSRQMSAISQNYCILLKVKPVDVLFSNACVPAMNVRIHLDPIVGLTHVVFYGTGCVD